MYKWAMLLCLLFVASCGGSSSEFFEDVPTGASPIVSRLSPAAGAVGTQVTIFGLGFSFEAQMNIVTMGTAGTVADSYSILAAPTVDEIETLTFTVPAGLVPGSYPVVVLVHEIPSNSDVQFTVTP